MGRLRAKSDYENLRNARIAENQARMASLGIEKSAGDLRSITTPTKPIKNSAPKDQKSVYSSTSLRRSARLKGKSSDHATSSSEIDCLSEPVRKKLIHSRLQLSPEVLSRRCNSKSRGSVYDPVLGICCHFCRQKKLCGEEDCKRCGNGGDTNQSCIGKTDCSVCHSSNGVLCRACLKVRYGEDMDQVRKNKEWMCPHCIEDEGIRPYWICNSSLCLRRRKIAPTGIAIYQAREMGYESVAHLVMDQLKQAARGR